MVTVVVKDEAVAVVLVVVAVAVAGVTVAVVAVAVAVVVAFSPWALSFAHTLFAFVKVRRAATAAL